LLSAAKKQINDHNMKNLMEVGELRFDQGLWLLLVESSCGHQWLLFYNEKPSEEERLERLAAVKLEPCATDRQSK